MVKKEKKEKKPKSPPQEEDDLNAIEEVPDWQPHCVVIAKTKDGDYSDMSCENGSCKSKKIKNNEPIFIYTEKDMNKKTKKTWNGEPRHWCIACSMSLVCEGGDITDFNGFSSLSDKAQTVAEKLFWKEKSKLSKKLARQRASTSETKSDEISSGVAAIDIKA
mmetsp:Transcript_42023/g.91154  ORF Transcript_42023/g.91154 Transcript_42023/m.91154 type:complete len:163 (+) Transcript_42023:125-613(+)